VVVPPPPPVALPPLLVVPLTPPPLRRRRRRVSQHFPVEKNADTRELLLTTFPRTEKEESDDDMGFGLFD
jgi:hypothetical protein